MLLDHGYAVRALVSPWGDTRNLAGVLDDPTLELWRADITEPHSLAGVCKGVEVVFHAAARTADWGRWQEFYKVNVAGTAHLVAEAKRSGVKRFVFISSTAVHRYSGFHDADPRTRPRDGAKTNAYARSKIMAEDVVMGASELEPVTVRPGLWLFGPRDPNFVRYVHALHGRGVPPLLKIFSPSLPVVGSGQTVINMAYVENLVQGLVLAAEAPGAAGKTYVIADEGCPTWLEAFACLADLIGAPRPKLHLPPALAMALSKTTETLYSLALPSRDPTLTSYKAGLMVNDVHFSIAHAKRELGYEPRLTWQEGLTRTVAALYTPHGRS